VKSVRADDVVLEDSHLSLYCFLCHRSLFNLVGGFIKDYPFGFFEDEEFAYRMRKYGYRQAIAGSSWIKHWGQATIRELWRTNQESRKILTEENRQKCIKDIRALPMSLDGNRKKPTQDPHLV
jgi:GT2 family glycosyltransferase